MHFFPILAVAATALAATVPAQLIKPSDTMVIPAINSWDYGHCPVDSPQHIKNPSFDDGLDGWYVEGGTKVRDYNDHASPSLNFRRPNGGRYLYMEVSPSSYRSLATQSVPLAEGMDVTLTFDWSYDVVATGTVPSDLECTLAVGYGVDNPVVMWTRRGSSGGQGFEAATFEYHGGNGDLTFVFTCDNTNYVASLAIDAVKMYVCNLHDHGVP